MLIGTTEFADLRHRYNGTGSQYISGSWADLEELLASTIDEDLWSPGNREGVYEVDLTKYRQQFACGVARLKDVPSWQLQVAYEPRREGEEPVLQITAPRKYAAEPQRVRVILYSPELLEGEKLISGELADYNIVTILADPDLDVPMSPIAMARNQLELVGGTKCEYTPSQWAEAVWAWNNKYVLLR